MKAKTAKNSKPTATTATATGTATGTVKTAEVQVTSNARVVTAIRAQFEAIATAESRKLATANVIREEAKRLKYDVAQTRKMTALSWREASGFTSTDKDEIKAFDDANKPHVSKVMTFVYPAEKMDAAIKSNSTPSAEMAKAVAHNSKVTTKHGRVSEERLLSIARGALTFDGAIAGAQPITKGAQPSKLTPAERFGNAVRALYVDYVEGNQLSEDEGKALFAKYFVKPKAEKKD